MREVLRFLVVWLARPSSLGALYLLGLVGLAAREGDAADQALGGQTKVIQSIVQQHFAGEIHKITLAIVAVTVLIGAVLGVAAGLLLALRDRIARLPRRSPLSRALGVLVLVAALHALIEAIAMAHAPQLYASAFYAQGGPLRLLQIVDTDVLGPTGTRVLLAMFILLVLAGPVSTWRAWPGRLRRAFLPHASFSPARSAARTGAAAGAGIGAAIVLALWLAPSPAREARADQPAAPADVSPDAAQPSPNASPGAAANPAPPAHKPPANPGRPNILILAADSLRADRLNPTVMPNLSRLAERGARFDRAYVSLPRTFPSWVTLLTGLHPHHHGIRSMFPRWEQRTKDFAALPGALSRAGYQTEVVSDFAGDIFDRIDLGWSRTRVPTFNFLELVRQRALERETPLLPFLHSRFGRRVFPVLREMNDAADPEMLASDVIDAIDAAKGGPFFMTVFFSAAHFPYAAPAPYYARFTDPGYRGRFKYNRPVGLEKDALPDAADVAQMRGLYDGAVASVDAAAGRILAALSRMGLDGRTIVVVVADHGETLWENGHGEGHGDHLFGDEGTHVPLVIYDPRAPAGKRVSSIVRDVDLAPTLYELTGVTPAGPLDGASLVPLATGAASPEGAASPTQAGRLAFAETGLWFTEDIAGMSADLRIPYPGVSEITEVEEAHHDDVVLKKEMKDLVLVAKHRMVRDDRYKLVYIPARAGVRYMLFDTESDPGETIDVAALKPSEVARLKGELWRWMLEDPAMEQRHGYLVPRIAGFSDVQEDESPAGKVIRIATGDGASQ